jgi:hypothetical protein
MRHLLRAARPHAACTNFRLLHWGVLWPTFAMVSLCAYRGTQTVPQDSCSYASCLADPWVPCRPMAVPQMVAQCCAWSSVGWTFAIGCAQAANILLMQAQQLPATEGPCNPTKAHPLACTYALPAAWLSHLRHICDNTSNALHRVAQSLMQPVLLRSAIRLTIVAACPSHWFPTVATSLLPCQGILQNLYR